uniref:Coronin 7 n=1 Tax=Latimeria chalumnae TaxID=7897 RepID=H3A9G4_LATCH
TLIPLHDADTGLLILAGKGDNTVHCFEVGTSQPAITQVNQCLTEGKSKGVAMVPKMAVDAMSGEVVRVLQLTDGFIVPISYTVPRKSYKEFHEDLFPDTSGNIPSMSAEEWWNGANKQVRKVSLNPTKLSGKAYVSSIVPGPATEERREAPSPGATKEKELPLEKGKVEQSGLSSPESAVTSPSTPSSLVQSPSTTSGVSSGFVTGSPSQRSLQSILGTSSKFRHIDGVVLHRDTHITNLKGLNLTTPGECDGFCVNRERVAMPLSTAGGQIAVLELSQPGRLPDTSIPTIQNVVAVADFSWDPFDLRRLAVACRSERVFMATFPSCVSLKVISQEHILYKYFSNFFFLRVHPLSSILLPSANVNSSLCLHFFNSSLNSVQKFEKKKIAFASSWSSPRKRIWCQSGAINNTDPPPHRHQIREEGPGPEGSRGARAVWVCGGSHLLVSGFDSRSERQLYLYNAESLSTGTVSRASMDVSPSILIPFYDEDTSTVFLTGKGETRVFIYEILPESPYFLDCNSFSSGDPHKGFAFLPKTECNVKEVEIAKALRLNPSSVEPVVFKVPRVKKDYFQDDIFPDTLVWWKPCLSASAWLSGSNGQHQKISLQPKDMTPVSAAPKEVPVRKYAPSSVILQEKTDEQKKEELLTAMVAKLGNREDPLPQDTFEGVDEEEWDD